MADGPYFDVRHDEREHLMMLVPPSVLLPVDPIKLTEQQRVTLSKMICNDLGDVGVKVLKELYLDACLNDRGDRRYCSEQHLRNVMRKNGVELHPDTFRLLASQFVDPRTDGAIEYEHLIRFISRALDLLNTENVYRMGSMDREWEMARLVETAKDQLYKRSYTLDVDKWEHGFEGGQESVPVQRIKDMCFKQNLPIDIEEILKLLEDPSSFGSIRWRSFVNFLKRAMPQRSHIQHERVTHRRNPPLEITPRGYERTSQDYGSEVSRRPPFTPRGTHSMSPRRYNENHEHTPRDFRTENGRFSTEPADPRLQQIQQKLKDIEDTNFIAKAQMHKHQPWIDRFMNLADALYNRDTSNRGSLPRHVIEEVYGLYNMAYGLGIHKETIDHLVHDPRFIDRNGNISLHPFLFALQRSREKHQTY